LAAAFYCASQLKIQFAGDLNTALKQQTFTLDFPDAGASMPHNFEV